MRKRLLERAAGLPPAFLLGALLGCGGDDAGPDLLADAGTDASLDAAGDAARDATVDVTNDAPPDAPSDAPSDAGPDAADATPPAFVTCAWARAEPVVLDDLATRGGAGTFYNGELYAAHTRGAARRPRRLHMRSQVGRARVLICA